MYNARSPAHLPANSPLRFTTRLFIVLLLTSLLPLAACERAFVRQADRDVTAILRNRQQAVTGIQAEADVPYPDVPADITRQAYDYTPNPLRKPVPDAFQTPATQPTTQPASAPEEEPALSRALDYMATPPPPQPPFAVEPPLPPPAPPVKRMTLTDALGYAQRHRRPYQSAKEDLYLATLALTLERHLWTPIFAGQLSTAYRNYGEITDFDQAMSFIANLSVSQRLPYGGEFTAQAVSEIVRDVKRTITAREGSSVTLGLRVPLLRGAGHVAREDLIQLERELTYSVRVFERFRRRQLVTVATAYFDLVLARESMIIAELSYENFKLDLASAEALEAIGQRSVLDTKLVEVNLLQAENTMETRREQFRAAADNFKLLIGMPVDEPLTRDQLEDIETIERKIERGVYPLLYLPTAATDEAFAVGVATRRRLDLRTLCDRIDDARRGVEISRNALLPDLDWNSRVVFDTDPDRYRLGHFHFERADWRSELVLELPLDRFAERNALRAALIDVRSAQRDHHDQTERVRTEVRAAVNRIFLAMKSVEIQQRALQAAQQRQEYAQLRYEEGEISNRDKVEAEEDFRAAQNNLNAAKVSRWNALLDFRLATETLRVDEFGNQEIDPDMPAPPDFRECGDEPPSP